MPAHTFIYHSSLGVHKDSAGCVMPASSMAEELSKFAVCSENMQFIYFEAERFGNKDTALKLEINFLLHRNKEKIDIYREINVAKTIESE